MSTETLRRFDVRPTTLASRLLAFAALAAVLALTWLVYHPGLTGGYLFDDFANLPSLGAYGPVDNATTFWRYITSGSADPTGRPIALLSFLLDARDWPADPYPFKRTSVLLHLLNGALLAYLLAQLGRSLGVSERQRRWAAILGAALWLLHPLFVSTTLYIVQREAMLPATFVLLGLIGYVAGHRRMTERRGGTLLAAASIAVCTLLGILSKANGALLPLFAWIVDAVLLNTSRSGSTTRTRAFAWMRVIALIVPSVLLFVYLAFETYAGFHKGVLAERPWTTGERLLTEPRVIMDYLALLWWPRPYSTGLFNDAIPVSTGLFTPPTTLFSIVAIATLLALATRARKRWPALSAALLFYFAGQLLESTSIPLELYFEHRNYVPALLMFWPLALWLVRDESTSAPSAHTAASSLIVVRRILAIALPIGLATLTYLRADLWGNRDDQALLWGEKNVHSPRAQAYAAQIESARGQTAAGIARLERALNEHPDDIQLALNLIGLKCTAGTLKSDDVARATNALRDTRNVGRLGFEWFEEALPAVQEHRCAALDMTALQALIEAAWENPVVQSTFGRRQDLLNLKARVALIQHDPNRALELFNEALDADPRPGAGLAQATTLATAGLPELALAHLDHLEAVMKPVTQPAPRMPAIHEWLLWREGYWPHEIAHLRGVLEDDVKAQAARTDAPASAH